jgi:hypothetical protein
LPSWGFTHNRIHLQGSFGQLGKDLRSLSRERRGFEGSVSKRRPHRGKPVPAMGDEERADGEGGARSIARGYDLFQLPGRPHSEAGCKLRRVTPVIV